MSFVEEELRRTANELFAGRLGPLRLDDLVELGWNELVADEASVAVGTLAEAQGSHRGTSRIVELEMSRRLELDPGAVALGFPWTGPALTSGHVDVVLLADAAGIADVVVPVAARDGIVLCPVPTAVGEPVDGIDPEIGWTRLRAEVDVNNGSPIFPERWTLAVASGRLALAHELIGVGQAMLELAVRHVTDRTQFGVPLGTFQSVQHRLADVHVDLEGARAITRSAWAGDDPNLCTAAHRSALRAVETATRHCHQVMGAIGCTWEHDMHRYIRRGVVLGVLLAADERTWHELVQSAASAQRTELFGS
ncbi:MAG TPA: acyl-CoA dehydrogenase family protein [Acidimicrobiales bacterium]|jgi:hypothetical protein